MRSTSTSLVPTLSLALFTGILINPASGEESLQKRYGLPDTDPAILENIGVNINCLTHINGGEVLGSYAAELVVTRGVFPVTLEVTHLSPTDSCEGRTLLRGNELSGIVIAKGPKEGSEDDVPFLYTMALLGLNEAGNYELTLEADGLFQIVGAGETLTGHTGDFIDINPVGFSNNTLYDLWDIDSHQLLNESWDLKVLDEAIEVTPPGSGEGTAVLINPDKMTAKYFPYSFQENVAAPALTLYEEAGFGSIFGTGDYEELSIPHICEPSNCSKNVNGSIIGSSIYEHGTYKLGAEGRDFVVSEVSATDLNGVTNASISGLETGAVITEGEEVEFTLTSGLTNGRQAMLQWRVEVEGMGEVLVDTVSFTSN